MADTLRVESSTAFDRLAHALAVDNGLSSEEGREGVKHVLRFLSALLDLPRPYYGTSPKTSPERIPEAA